MYSNIKISSSTTYLGEIGRSGRSGYGLSSCVSASFSCGCAAVKLKRPASDFCIAAQARNTTNVILGLIPLGHPPPRRFPRSRRWLRNMLHRDSSERVTSRRRPSTCLSFLCIKSLSLPCRSLFFGVIRLLHSFTVGYSSQVSTSLVWKSCSRSWSLVRP